VSGVEIMPFNELIEIKPDDGGCLIVPRERLTMETWL
jgi:hypothetical protein